VAQALPTGSSATLKTDIHLKVMMRPISRTVWIGSAIGCLLVTVIFFVFFDVPIMRFFSGSIGKLDTVSRGLGTAVVLSVDGATALALVFLRALRGKERFPALFRVLALACLTSICVFAINDSALKLFFGVPNPGNVFLQGMRHAFHLLAGSRDSSFPSGHMMLASSFAGVFMRLYPRTIIPLAILLLIAAVALIVGDWHFVSDVIAGTSLGIGAGLLVGDLWLDHIGGMAKG
jgi:membrane-associated phospholipid phosphatase